MLPTPTPYPAVNSILSILYDRIQPILGRHFIGMYLDGSLTSGDFDQDSDIDFIVVTDEDVKGSLFDELKAMHGSISKIDSVWAVQLEGSYISLAGIRRFDPDHALHPNIERGEGESLKMAVHDQTWDVHRHILHQRGITLAGHAPRTLIDPVTHTQLEKAMLLNLSGWAKNLLENPAEMKQRGYQSFIVLSLCRILFTLQNHEVASKRSAVDWALNNLEHRWAPLLLGAWEGRSHGGDTSSSGDVAATCEFIRYVLSRNFSSE